MGEGDSKEFEIFRSSNVNFSTPGHLVGSISAALSGPVCVPPRRERFRGGAQAHFPKQRLVIEPRHLVNMKFPISNPSDHFR